LGFLPGFNRHVAATPAAAGIDESEVLLLELVTEIILQASVKHLPRLHHQKETFEASSGLR